MKNWLCPKSPFLCKTETFESLEIWIWNHRGLVFVVLACSQLDIVITIGASLYMCAHPIMTLPWISCLVKGTTKIFGVHVYHDRTMCRMRDPGPSLKGHSCPVRHRLCQICIFCLLFKDFKMIRFTCSPWLDGM